MDALTSKKAVTHHALAKQKKNDCQDEYKQKLSNSERGWLRSCGACRIQSCHQSCLSARSGACHGTAIHMIRHFPCRRSNCIAPQPVVSYLYYQAVVRSKPDLTFGGVVREITGASDRSSRREARTCFRFHLVPPRKGVFVSFLDTYTRFLRSALWRVFGSSQEFKSQRDTDFEPTISTHDSHVSHVFSRT